MIVSKSQIELDMMREAGRIVAMTHQELAKAIRPGITTKELDQIAEEFIKKNGGQSSFKGYHGYPASICTSVNEELVHGIPGNRTLKDGDIISIDIGVHKNGYHGDSAWTYPVGTISDVAAKLLRVTEESLLIGIEQAREGNRLSDIGHAVQQHVEAAGFSVVRDYVGHGIGREMHEDPQIPNYGPPNRGVRLKAGMTLAIEPMVNVGTYHCKTLADNWTVVTADGTLSAHFEHTVAVTKDGPVILTCL
ncbi:type I methionyl aminopeptidase [Effusibacillus dendaii]|uniref:Methionine aminopeptidase n=1 Tax=Effusibacillus dendaii TaxID=2743772 RepID=A0A7I8DBE0_9BACL|nr:type I methionyl aminopeptidase [Effusibacillus dendaii]BCJ87317.1 methionine aminopeptidase 1 [Effusibacillus dendaii]